MRVFLRFYAELNKFLAVSQRDKLITFELITFELIL
jgi:hypothetical protein